MNLRRPTLERSDGEGGLQLSLPFFCHSLWQSASALMCRTLTARRLSNREEPSVIATLDHDLLIERLIHIAHHVQRCANLRLNIHPDSSGKVEQARRHTNLAVLARKINEAHAYRAIHLRDVE